MAKSGAGIIQNAPETNHKQYGPGDTQHYYSEISIIILVGEVNKGLQMVTSS